jgi:hypothetical protein
MVADWRFDHGGLSLASPRLTLTFYGSGPGMDTLRDRGAAHVIPLLREAISRELAQTPEFHSLERLRGQLAEAQRELASLAAHAGSLEAQRRHAIANGQSLRDTEAALADTTGRRRIVEERAQQISTAVDEAYFRAGEALRGLARPGRQFEALTKRRQELIVKVNAEAAPYLDELATLQHGIDLLTRESFIVDVVRDLIGRSPREICKPRLTAYGNMLVDDAQLELARQGRPFAGQSLA